MTTRSTAHAEGEKAIFDAFVAAYPSFAASIKNVEQPDAEFPDVIVELKDGTVIDFEFGEWLDGAQMASAKRYDALADAMIDTLGPQGENPSRHFRAVMLTPREDSAALSGADRDAFREQIWALVGDTDRRWPTERFWHSPQGRICREFDGHPLAAKYLLSVHFDPLVVRGEEHRWPAGQPWIFVEPRGGSYSPDTALRALTGILDQKIRHYGRFARPTRLVIHYGKAAAYNTPYVGIETRGFADVARAAADAVRGQTAFEKIYVLHALEPELEAFEIYPTCTRCT